GCRRCMANTPTRCWPGFSATANTTWRNCALRGRPAAGRRGCDMAVSLCVPPRAGELCAPVRFLVRQDSVVIELTARHRITSVEWDEKEHAVAMVVEITDPQTARPIDVRIDVLEPGAAADAPPAAAHATIIGTITRDGRTYHVKGTYLG